MPVTSPPVIDPLTGTPPNRGQTEEEFNINQQNFVDYQVGFVPDVNTLATWFNYAATYAETKANAAGAATALTAADVITTQAAKVDAQAAAAAAQQAAGLTPDPNFGMVIATTSTTDVKTAAYLAVAGKLQDVDTSAGAFAITTPVSPSYGQWFGVRDYNQNAFSGVYPWLDYVSDKIIGLAEDHFVDVNTAIYEWRGPTKGWCL